MASVVVLLQLKPLSVLRSDVLRLWRLLVFDTPHNFIGGTNCSCFRISVQLIRSFYMLGVSGDWISLDDGFFWWLFRFPPGKPIVVWWLPFALACVASCRVYLLSRELFRCSHRTVWARSLRFLHRMGYRCLQSMTLFSQSFSPPEIFCTFKPECVISAIYSFVSSSSVILVVSITVPCRFLPVCRRYYSWNILEPIRLPLLLFHQ